MTHAYAMTRTALALTLAMFAHASVFGRQAAPPGAEPVRAPRQTPEITNPHKPFSVMVGDPAPAIAIKEYILGEPVAAFEPGKVYLIFVWSVWDEQAISIMPRLTELQNRFGDKGLVIIGATSPGQVNTQAAVRDFVFSGKVPVGFSVAWDPTRVVMDGWLHAAGRTSVPCLFIVDQSGRIAFIGGVAEYEKPLLAVLEETNDLDLDTRRYYDCITATWAYQHWMQKIKAKDWPNASNLGREIVNGRGHDCFAVLNNIAWAMVDPKNPPDVPDLDLALSAASRADELAEGKDADTIDTLARVHFLKGDIEKAIDLQQRAVAVARSDKLREPLAKTLEDYKAALAKSK